MVRLNFRGSLMTRPPGSFYSSIFFMVCIVGVTILFARRIAPDARTLALFNAIEQKHSDAIPDLIRRGANVNAKDKIGLTPLMRAAMYGRKDAIPLLVASGADVNAQTDNRQHAPDDCGAFQSGGRPCVCCSPPMPIPHIRDVQDRRPLYYAELADDPADHAAAQGRRPRRPEPPRKSHSALFPAFREKGAVVFFLAPVRDGARPGAMLCVRGYGAPVKPVGIDDQIRNRQYPPRHRC